MRAWAEVVVDVLVFSSRIVEVCFSTKGIRTLMGDLKDRPQHLVLLLALVRGVLGVLHLVGELEQRVFDIVEALWGRLAVAGCAEGRHGCYGVT
jgi:hypothetical protein